MGTILPDVSDSVLAVCAVALGYAVFRFKFNGDLSRATTEMKARIKGEPTEDELRQVFEPITEDKKIERSLLDMQNSLYAEDIRRSLTDQNTIADHKARSILRETGKLIQSGRKEGYK